MSGGAGSGEQGTLTWKLGLSLVDQREAPNIMASSVGNLLKNLKICEYGFVLPWI
jgi:hypothetical protein